MSHDIKAVGMDTDNCCETWFENNIIPCIIEYTEFGFVGIKSTKGEKCI